VKYRVRHVTTYSYGKPVDLASHLLHLAPRALPFQRVLESAIIIEPRPSRVHDGEDHFGNRVAWVFLDLPHEKFVVTMRAQVEVAFPAPPARSIAWEAVVAAARGGGPHAWQPAEFAFDSPMAEAHAGAGAYAAESFTPGRPVLDGLIELNGRIRRDFAFKAGVTTVHTPVSKVLAQRAGVCQDFSHLMIAGLRFLGLPARYVSGYIRTKPPPGIKPRLGADQSHAWVGAWLGPDHGWVDLDPTNDLVVRDEHVVLAWGRDYGDISPVRGIILGGGKHSVTAGVDLEAM
jgi:transglutaminase-like putative cysteine protease